LKAEEDVTKGTLVQEYMGEIIDDDEWRRRLAEYDHDTPVYMFTLDQETYIDASMYGSLARFINHSCDPNCYTQKWQVGGEERVGIFANRDIQRGEEFSYDYKFESFGSVMKKCHC